MIRINYAALPAKLCPSSQKNTRQRFRCWLDDGTPLPPCRSPAHDGARALIALGYDPSTPMTTRSSQSEHDSWVPAPISHFAGLSVSDSDTSPTTQIPYVPRAFNGPTL